MNKNVAPLVTAGIVGAIYVVALGMSLHSGRQRALVADTDTVIYFPAVLVPAGLDEDSMPALLPLTFEDLDQYPARLIWDELLVAQSVIQRLREERQDFRTDLQKCEARERLRDAQ